MADFLLDACPGASTTGLVFTGQEINPETEGRPDLVASDPAGTRLVVEAKFDAEMTLAQTSGAYVNKLTAGVAAALAFLVPRDRMQNVWRTISVTPGGAAEPVALPEGALDAGIATMPLGATGHVLAVVSWESMLNRMSAAVGKFGDTAGAAELAQLRGLVEWRTTVGWVPLVPGDLPQRAGRQLQAISETIKSVCSRVSSSKMRNGSADGGFGRYISTPSGKSIWVGIWLHWWDAYGPGPVWAQVSLKTPQEMSLTSDALTGAGIMHHSRPEYTDVLIPLRLPVGAEQGAVELDLVTQVNAVIAALNNLAVEVIEDDAEHEDVSSP
ncbi:hypothetical protein [Kribbella sp. NPDC048928]|uniref:hypothetical protein n=1 Tax=Kribbella sp. NPDC048928 TaxID=3364111 RepID=UPI0037241F18